MYQTKSFVYHLEYNGKEFDYYSIFDNGIVNYVYNQTEQMTKISTMEIGLLKRDIESIQKYHYLSAHYLPLLNFLREDKCSGECLFLDSTNISIQLKYVKELLDLPDRYNTVFFYCFNPESTQSLIEAFKNKNYFPKQINISDTSLSLFYVQKKQEKSEGEENDGKGILFSSVDDVGKIIHQCLSKLIFDRIHQDDDQEDPKNTYSSNVYSNRYINLRKVFSDSNIATLVTTELLHLIMSVDGLEFDAFVCASITGACIASYLSVYIKKPVLFLRNIGPNITTEDELIVERIYPHKKYVYIFDFMCLGTEYQRTKLICALKKSSIIKCFGISYYKKPNRGNPEDIQTLFHINDYLPDFFKCAVDENDLRNGDEKNGQE